jgi:hypothetical protein
MSFAQNLRMLVQRNTCVFYGVSRLKGKATHVKKQKGKDTFT